MLPKRQNLYAKLHQRQIAFIPIYMDIMGNAAGGILLSQLMYWFSIKTQIYKTNKELMEETHLSPWDLKAGKSAILEKVPFVKIWKMGNPPVTNYKINWKVWRKFLQKWVGKNPTISQQAETAHSNGRKPPALHIHQNTHKKGHKSSTPSKLKIVQSHPRWKIWAKKLAKAIAKGQGKDWNGEAVRGADEFRKLHTIREKVPLDELREMVLWYCEKVGSQNYLFLGRDQYIPVCGNGFTFRDKWEKLLGAKAKDQNWEYEKPTKKRKFNVVSQTVIKNK